MQLLIQNINPFFYCILYLISFYGFGVISISCSRLKQPHIPIASIGLCTFIIFSGLAASFHLATIELFLVLLLIGTLVGGLTLYGKLKRFTRPVIKPTALHLVMLSGLFLWVFFDSNLLYETLLNRHDDYHSYLVGPIKLLQTGWLGFEPFGHRFLTSSMGGYSAFLAYGLLLGDENFLYFFEFWVACCCFVEVIWCAHKQRESSLTIFIALSLVCLLCAQPILNATSTVSSAALYLAALYLGFTHPKSQTDSKPLYAILALILTALLVMKSANLPGVVFLTLCFLWQSKITQTRLIFLLTFCVGIFFWGYAHFETTGTFFYPFLGRGFSCYDPPYFIFEYAWPLSKIITTFLTAFWYMPIFLLCCATFILHLFAPTHLKRAVALTLLFFAIAVGLAILCRFGPFERTSPSTYLRYGIPFWQALLVFSLWEFKWKEWGTNSNRLYKDKRPLGLLVLLTLFFLVKTVEMRWQTFERAINFKETRIKYETLLSPTKLEGYLHKAQNTIPTHKRILVRASRPHLLDFSRNEIFVSDQPNFSGFENCIATQSNSPKEFAAYFLKHHIQYVLYSYGDQAGFEKEKYNSWLSKEDRYWQVWAKQTFDFQNVLLEMKNHYQPLYDDGFTFVLDLNKPIQ